MRTPSVLMTSFSTSSTPSILPQNLMINSSEQPSACLNSSSWSLVRSPDLSMTCFIMIFGTISNLTALGILARVRYRRQTKAPFLLLTVALLLADLGGHLIPGAFALYLHIDLRYKTQCGKSNKEFCQVFGASMVFFGLCPLLLGCAMAVERFVAITQPFFHAAMITVAHVRRIVLFLSSFALVLAVLPLFSVGTYTTQFPGTWCFLPIHGSNSTADTNLVLSFSCLGLTALTLSVLCNILSGLALLQARRKSNKVNTKSAACRTRSASSASVTSLFCSLDVEMMVQLAVITAASCICWSPFLIRILVIHFNQSNKPSAHEEKFTLLSLQMASCNQILDPWVYILLRRAMLFKVCPAIYTTRPTSTGNSSCADTRNRRALSLQWPC